MSGGFNTSDEFVIFASGAAVALCIMTVTIWALIIDLHICAPSIIESTVDSGKDIDDEKKLRPVKGHESDGEITLIFDEDEEEEDDNSVSHYETV
jgi:hypothetical protein